MSNTAEIRLPGRAAPLEVSRPGWADSYRPPRSRRAFAAAHVAAGPDGEIDWTATLAFREHLWEHGFGVAEAMDTAQRGMGLSWPQARELINRSAARAAELRTADRVRGGDRPASAGRARAAAPSSPPTRSSCPWSRTPARRSS